MADTTAISRMLMAENPLYLRMQRQPIGANEWAQSATNQTGGFDPLVGFIGQRPVTQGEAARMPFDPISGRLNESGEMLANMLMGATSAPISVPGRISKYAADLGYSVSRDASKISGSEYLALTHDKMPDATLKVRISNHDLPSKYGPPGDFDVHLGQPRDMSVAWHNVVDDLARRVGAPTPAPVQNILTKQRNAAAVQAAAMKAEQEARAAREAQWAMAREVRGPSVSDRLSQAFPDDYKSYMGMGRKDPAKQKLWLDMVERLGAI